MFWFIVKAIVTIGVLRVEACIFAEAADEKAYLGAVVVLFAAVLDVVLFTALWG